MILSGMAGTVLRIEHREAGNACAYRHLVLQRVPVLGEFAALDPEDTNPNPRLVSPAADTAMDGDQITLGDDQARLVIDGR